MIIFNECNWMKLMIKNGLILLIGTEKLSLLTRLFRKSSIKKRSITSNTFCAQFPPPEWLDAKVLHLHSVAVQTQFAESSTAESIVELVIVVIFIDFL